MPDACPEVSVVTATYHRPKLLRRALETLRAQTIEDWEGIVVGDACTDETGTVVEDISDPRLRFTNLPKNVGDQSGPNNEGIAQARAPVVALLNQDDMFFPDHLERCVAELERTGADIVLATAALLRPQGRIEPACVAPGDQMAPWVRFPASALVFRREAATRIGPWKHANELFNTPPAEWLARATRAGLEIRLVPWLTLVAFQSGARPGSYLVEDNPEHRSYTEEMLTDPDALRTRLLTRIALDTGGVLVSPWSMRALGRRLVRDVSWRLGGWRLMPLRHAVRYRRRGGFVKSRRKTKGLPNP